jgi:exonuclease SbcC
MRILAIRGYNLASLSDKFEIDLTAPPLSGTGLFAIVGETGAGKSTILDALCLALYGEYPRSRGGAAAERSADPSGEEVMAGNPSNILRRGTGRGYAEVDFIAQDGLAYRVRWEVQRARAKANGRLQDARRSIERRDGSGAVATGKRDVLAAVERLTGLTFEQFRRTVLLAQGEFDAFLMAGEKERSDLLERVTGTGIYSAISMRVHEETAARKRAVEDLDKARGFVVVLGEAEREAMLAEASEKRVQLAEAEARQAKAAMQVKHASDIGAARHSLAAAATELAAARQRQAAAGDDRARMAELDAARPLRPMVEVHAKAEGHAAAQEMARATAAEAAETAARQLAGLEIEAKRLQAVASAAAADIARWQPLWSEATALDLEVAAAASEAAQADKALADARANLSTRRKQVADIADRRAGIEADVQALASDLAARAAHASLAAAIQRVDTLVGDHAGLSRRLDETSVALARCDSDAKALDDRIAATEGRHRLEDRRKAEIAARIAERRQAWQRMNAAALAARDDALSVLARQAASAHEAAVRRDEARAGEERSRRAAEAAAREMEAAARDRSGAETSLEAERRARAELQHMGDLAEATVSVQAARLRAALAEGEPCPVCGAREHPFAHDEAAARFALALRQRTAVIEKRIAEAEARITAARGLMAAAEARSTEALRARTAATEKAAAAARQLAQLSPPMWDGAARLGLAAALRHDGEPVAAEVLQSLVAEIEGQSRLARQGRANADALRHEIESLRQDEAQLAAALAGEVEALEKDRVERAEVATRKAELDATRRIFVDQLSAVEQELAPHLDAAGLAVADLARDAKSARRHLRTLADRHATLAEAHERQVNALKLIEPEQRAANDGLAAAELAAQEAATADERCRLAHTRLREARSARLDGEATEAHRSRFMAVESAARKALEAVRPTHDEARLAAERGRTTKAMAEQAARRAVEEVAASASAFVAAAAALGLDQEKARALLAVPESDVAALATRLAALDRSVAAAESIHQTREGDLAARLAAGAEMDAAALQALKEACAERATTIDQIKARLTAIGLDVERDDRERGRVSALMRELEAAKAEHSVWAEVAEAIGSADGSKFRRFAQGVTLGHLVRLANVQLQSLNPRYALIGSKTSDLSIDVLDRDMGDEVRHPRSLSGGERFLVSLALALALSGLEGRQSFVDTLFIDEGFGVLDRETLDMAVDALETLQGQGRKVGVVTHAASMIDRIAVQVRVEKRGGGRSVVRIRDTGFDVGSRGGGPATAG